MNRVDVRGESRRGAGSLVRVVGLFLVVAAVAGCATTSGGLSDEAQRKLVAERAAGRWALIIKGDPGAAYDEYLSKGSRTVIPRSEFVARMRVTAFRTANVEKVECDGATCKATVEITYDHRMMKGVENTMRETWVMENGQAWYVWLL